MEGMGPTKLWENLLIKISSSLHVKIYSLFRIIADFAQSFIPPPI